MADKTRSPRKLLGWMLAIAAFSALWWAPATTKQGVNFKVRTVQIPLAVKAMDFLVRDWKYRSAAAEIASAYQTTDERILSIYEWTRANIRPQPENWPVIDDHILHIMIRGYGTSDQMADVFTTLCAYAGVPAYWRLVRASPDKGAWVLSFARTARGWTVLDVRNGIVFREESGALVPAAELSRHPELVASAVGDRMIDDLPYAAYLSAIGDTAPPSPLRAELQMPGRRLFYELKRAAGLAGKPA